MHAPEDILRWTMAGVRVRAYWPVTDPVSDLIDRLAEVRSGVAAKGATGARLAKLNAHRAAVTGVARAVVARIEAGNVGTAAYLIRRECERAHRTPAGEDVVLSVVPGAVA